MKAMLGLLIWLIAMPAAAQSVAVAGLDGHARTFTLRDLAALPRDKVTTKSHEGMAVTYEGATLAALLQAVGAPMGKGLRGPAMTDIVVVTAKDGYRVALSLPETDASIRSERILVADEADGHPIAAPEGPLRLVVEGDLRPARSVRMVTKIQLVAIPRSRATRQVGTRR